MEIELRLKKVLQDFGLDDHGITQRIASELGVHRHTIGKIYRNELKNPSLKVLGELCGWLEQNDVPGEQLPGALFGSRPSELWQAVAEPGTVRVYLGEYQQTSNGTTSMLWISRRDATCAGEIVKALSTPSNIGQGHTAPTVLLEYVQYRIHSTRGQLRKKDFRPDILRSKRAFQKMRSHGGKSTAVLVGSQRVNHLVEHLVADFFDCDPFTPDRKRGGVPFFVVYRDLDRAVPACFGGVQNPPGWKGAKKPGVYYLKSTRAGGLDWVHCPWRSRSEGAGVVIIGYEPGTQRLEMALIGFSGWCTEALSRQPLRPQGADRFWPPYIEKNGKQMGVFICRFKMKSETTPEGGEIVRPTHFGIVTLDERVIERCLG